MPKLLLIEDGRDTHIQQEGKNLFIHGLALSNKPNKNSRFYSEAVLDNAVEHLQEKLKSGSLFGTLGHGSGSDMSVDPKNIATVVKSLTKTKDGYVGRSQVIDSGAGAVLGSIIKAGGKLGTSSRGTGSIVRDKKTLLDHVQDDFRVSSLDIVESPSTGTAGLFSAIYESVASDTMHSQTLDKDDLDFKVRSILRGLGRADLNVDFDQVYGTFQNPHSDLTYLEHLEKLRAEILQTLLKVQQDIAAEKSGDFSNLKDVYAQYATALSKESSPIKRVAIRREAKEQHYGTRLIESTIRLLSRGGSRFTENIQTNTDVLIQTIRKNAGKRLTSTQKECEAVSREYDSLEKTAREHYERSKAANLKTRARK